MTLFVRSEPLQDTLAKRRRSQHAARSSSSGLLIGGTPILVIARPSSLQKLLGNEVSSNSVSSCSKARLSGR